MKNSFYFITIAIFVLFLSGCSNKTLPPLKTYHLTPSEKCCDNNFTQKPLTLQILEPTTNKYLNSTSLYYSDNKYQLQTYKLSKWSDYPTKMILEVLISKLDELNMYQNITTNNIYAKADYILQSELFDFKQVIEKNDSFILLKIKFYLIDEDDLDQAVSKTFSYKIKSNTINAYGAIEAFNKACDLMLKDLALWLDTHSKEK